MGILKRNEICATDLNINRNRRLPMCICIDATKSAFPTDSDRNKLIRSFTELMNTICNDISTRAAVDLMIMTYTSQATVVREFGEIREKEECPEFQVTDETPCMFGALEVCLRELQRRLGDYERSSRSTYHPVVVIISGGETSESEDRRKKGADKWKSLEQAGLISVIPILSGNGEGDLLRSMTSDGRIATASTSGFDQPFAQIGKSVRQLSASSSAAYQNLKEGMSKWKEAGEGV